MSFRYCVSYFGICIAVIYVFNDNFVVFTIKKLSLKKKQRESIFVSLGFLNWFTFEEVHS